MTAIEEQLLSVYEPPQLARSRKLEQDGDSGKSFFSVLFDDDGGHSAEDKTCKSARKGGGYHGCCRIH